MEILKYGKAICYSGYRKGQSPKTVAPTKEQIAEDLDILHKAGYDYIRMYDPNLHARRALEVIKEKDLPIKCIDCFIHYWSLEGAPQIAHGFSLLYFSLFSSE